MKDIKKIKIDKLGPSCLRLICSVVILSGWSDVQAQPRTKSQEASKAEVISTSETVAAPVLSEKQLQIQAIKNNPIPKGVLDLMQGFQPKLSANFMEVLPGVVNQFIADTYSLTYDSATVCNGPVEIHYNDSQIQKLLAAKGVKPTDAEWNFLGSLAIVHGCGRVSTNDNKKVLDSFLDTHMKRSFQPEVTEFTQSGPDRYCEKVEVEFMGMSIGSTNSCYKASHFPTSTTPNPQGLSPMQGFQTWEVFSTPQNGDDPIYFRGCLFLAKNTKPNETMVHYFTIGRWQEMNGFTKMAANAIFPPKTKAGFDYLERTFGHR